MRNMIERHSVMKKILQPFDNGNLCDLEIRTHGDVAFIIYSFSIRRDVLDFSKSS